MEDIILIVVYAILFVLAFKIIISTISGMIKFSLSIVIIGISVYSYYNYNEVKDLVFNHSKEININTIKSNLSKQTDILKETIKTEIKGQI